MRVGRGIDCEAQLQGVEIGLNLRLGPEGELFRTITFSAIMRTEH